MARRTAFLLVALLLLLGLGLRASGIGYLLPEVLNRDGLVVERQVEFFRTGVEPPGDRSWWYASYPHLMARVAALLPAPAPPYETASPVPLPLEEHLALASAPWIRLRWVSVVLSLLAVPGTYLLARRFLERASALLAAALVATSLHHVVLSIQEKPHGLSASFVLLALLAALRLRRKPSAGSVLLAGLAAGLAAASLHSGAAALLPVAAAWLLRERQPEKRAAWAVPAALVVVALACALAYPFFLEGRSGAAPEGAPVAVPDLSGFVGRILGSFGGAPVGRICLALLALDPVLVVLGTAGILLGALRLLKERPALRRALRGDLGVVLALALPVLAVLVLFERSLVRFFLPLTPLLACAAAYAVARLRRAAPRAGAALGIAAVALALVPAAHFARIRREPGPLREAARWIEANVPPDDTIVVVPNVDLPLLPDDASIAANAEGPYRTIWSQYLASVPAASLDGLRRPIRIEPGRRPDSRRQLVEDPPGYLRSNGARFLVLDLSGGGEDRIGARLDEVASFSPMADPDSSERGMALFGTGYDPLAPTASRVLRARSMGTSVRILVPRD